MKNKQRGVALVEFALTLPFLLILTLITTEFGRALYQYNAITKSVRDAVRYLSVQTPNTKIAETKSLVVFGNTTNTGLPLAPGLSISQVSVISSGQTAGTLPSINIVSITVSGYTFTPLFSSIFGVNFGRVTYSPIQATMRSAI